jgi:hypothetical protein
MTMVGGGTGGIVKVHTGPVVVTPLLSCVTICQKSVVLLVSVPDPVPLRAWTSGGGLLVPKETS